MTYDPTPAPVLGGQRDIGYNGQGIGYAPAPTNVQTPAPEITYRGSTHAELAYNAVRDANRAIGAAMSDLGKNAAMYSEHGRATQLEAIRTAPALGQMLAAVEHLERHQATKAAEADETRARMRPLGDTASEMRATRVWDRHRRSLDGQDGGTLVTTALAALRDSSMEDLGVLCEELAPYLSGRGVESAADLVDHALREKVPAYGNQRADAEKLAQAVVMARTAASRVADGVARGSLVSDDFLAAMNPAEFDADK